MNGDKTDGKKVEIWVNGQRIEGDAFWTESSLADVLKGQPRANEPIPGLVEGAATLDIHSVGTSSEYELEAIIYPGEDGMFVAEVPRLPGCISQGATQEEAIANIKEAAALWIEDFFNNSQQQSE